MTKTPVHEAFDSAIEIASRLQLGRDDIWTLAEGIFARFTAPDLRHFIGTFHGAAAHLRKDACVDRLAEALVTELEIAGVL